MEKFTHLTSVAAVIDEAGIDTDVIFPARFLLITEKTGLGRYAFFEKRFAADGSRIPDFVLNRAPFDKAKILIAGDNFGCGSSREQAPWALHDLGIRCLISSGFGEIFEANCYKNGMLPIRTSPSMRALVAGIAETGALLQVDLATRTVSAPSGLLFRFDIQDWRRDALLQGLDEIELIRIRHAAAIADFEKRQKARMSWLYEEGVQ